ncbi:hypothetical protein [Nocardioides pyridinolyticus]
MSFNVRERRLVLDGPCWAEDALGLADAIHEAAGQTHALVLDLTRVNGLPREAAAAITRARCAVEARGCGVTVWALPGGAVERDLADAMRGEAVPT